MFKKVFLSIQRSVLRVKVPGFFAKPIGLIIIIIILIIIILIIIMIIIIMKIIIIIILV